VNGQKEASCYHSKSILLDTLHGWPAPPSGPIVIADYYHKKKEQSHLTGKGADELSKDQHYWYNVSVRRFNGLTEISIGAVPLFMVS